VSSITPHPIPMFYSGPITISGTDLGGDWSAVALCDDMYDVWATGSDTEMIVRVDLVDHTRSQCLLEITSPLSGYWAEMVNFTTRTFVFAFR